MSDDTRPTGGGPRSAGPVRIAFFDVDETLIDTKSMFSFLEFHLADPDRYRAAAGELTRAARAGVPREETNRAYYRNYAGMEQTAVAESGRRWFARERQRDGFFHEEAVRELRRFRAEGCQVALVSGSFRACLDPIAEHLGADHLLCGEPEVVVGRYTGEVRGVMIGEAKATAARALMKRSGARPEDCVAYGDHASDLPLLTCVGGAGVVGADPVLAEHADRFGWIRLPGTGGSAAAAQGSAAADPSRHPSASPPAAPLAPSARPAPITPAAPITPSAPSTPPASSTEEPNYATR
ncbi:HAD-IB family hydrolase [Streptomyces sp. NPDC086182]|uniref:HAD family hydrolase n=1 Tax=Streptomyces sp. NPDC086182 TaxID=3155058 RepID=UPI0034206DA2